MVSVLKKVKLNLETGVTRIMIIDVDLVSLVVEALG